MKCPYKGFRRSLTQKQVFDKNNPYYNKNICHQKLSYIMEFREFELVWKIQAVCERAATGS